MSGKVAPATLIRQGEQVNGGNVNQKWSRPFSGLRRLASFCLETCCSPRVSPHTEAAWQVAQDVSHGSWCLLLPPGKMSLSEWAQVIPASSPETWESPPLWQFPSCAQDLVGGMCWPQPKHARDCCRHWNFQSHYPTPVHIPNLIYREYRSLPELC